MREQRLSEDMEQYNDNTIEITRNKKEFRCMLCNRNLHTNRGLMQPLQKKKKEAQIKMKTW